MIPACRPFHQGGWLMSPKRRFPSWVVVTVAVGGVLAGAIPAWSGDSAALKPRPTVTGDGTPLPRGAIARLGTSRLRSLYPDFVLSRDAQLVALRNYHSIHVWSL